MLSALRLVCFALIVSRGSLAAAVIVIGNGSPDTMTFTLAVDAGKAEPQAIPAGDTRAYSCDKSAIVTFGPPDQPTVLTLDAYVAYVFTNRNDALKLTGIQLEGQPPPVGVLPSAELSRKPLVIPVKLLVDDSERRTRAAWEPVLRKRFARAAAIVEAHSGVRYDLIEADTWDADPKALDMKALFADFAKVVRVPSGTLAIGYTSRKFDAPGNAVPKAVTEALPFAAPAVALQSHLLIREREPKSEAERVEVLAQQLGRHLGATFVPDRGSVMRPRLGDGQASQVKFAIRFDPLNVLAMRLVADELRGGKVLKLADLSSATQTRLGRIYGTARTALPDEPLPDVYLGLLDRAGLRVPDGVVTAGGTAILPRLPDAGRTRNAKEEAVRIVVQAVAARAAINAKLPSNNRTRGDELTGLYVRTAATAASRLEPEYRVSAFLLALGLALDDSNVLRDNPLTASFCKAIETEDERRQRMAVLGIPTVRNRRDLCQHFVISAALTEMVGPDLAEAAGLMKEQADLAKSSGFSFTDICADFAGIEFARRTMAKNDLGKLDDAFAVADYVPSIDGLRDGISAAKFKADFVSTTNVKFKAATDAIWKRVRAQPVYDSK